MNEDFNLEYGVKSGDLNLIRQEVSKIFDIDFVERHSDYLGRYYKYEGLFADRLTIIEGKYLSTDTREHNHEIIIRVNISSGKKKDKISKYKYLKEGFRKMPEIELLSFSHA